MTKMTELLDLVAQGERVSSEAFGGPDSILVQFGELLAYDPVSTTVVLCDTWHEHDDRQAALKMLLMAAADDSFDLDEVHDVILSNRDVVADSANQLVAVFASHATSPGLRGDVYSESWTRLTLGGWTVSLPLRAHLAMRAATAASAGDTTAFLVRATSAALVRWGDDELEDALQSLGDLDEFSTTVQFELGLKRLGDAASATDGGTGIDALRQAVAFLKKAGDRADALAFRTPLNGLLRFIDGGQVTTDEVTAAKEAVHTYLLGYRGLQHHWRQGRADTSRGWSQLLEMLAGASRIDDTNWFSPIDVITAAGALFIAKSTVDVISSDDEPELSIAGLVRPRIISALAKHAPSVEFLDAWLDAEPAGTDQRPMRAAVEQLRSEIAKPSGAPLAFSNSVSKGTYEQVQEFLDGLVAAQRQPTATDVFLSRRVLADIEAIVPEEVTEVASSLMGVILTLVQFTAFHLNLKQTGQRKVAWLGEVPDSDGKYPKEHVLSDHLAAWFNATGMRLQLETVNTGGGDADIAIRFPNHTFYVEVKRVLSKEDDAAATSHYGTQAAQYAGADVPIVFLALLDYVKRAVRIDLDGTIWTRPHQPDPASRTYAITGYRIQGNVESPSKATANWRKPKKGPSV